MTTMSHGAEGAFQRARIEALLAKYPHTEPDELADLLYWFRKQASALDVGMLASEPHLAEPYQRFKADHLDRLRGADVMAALLFIMMACGAVGLIMWRAV